MCRKPQVLDLDSLQVDTYLQHFIEGLNAISKVSVSDVELPEEALSLQLAAAPPLPPPSWGIIPPPLLEHRVRRQCGRERLGSRVLGF